MEKYSRKLIFDYVSGNDVGKYSIDELENDHKFMMKVIEFTNDKKMYNLCSDDVKNNYEFVKFMILTFKEDKDFICEIAKNYIDKIDEEDITYKELVILMGNFATRNSNDEFFSYKTKAFAFYNEEKIEIEICFREVKDEYLLRQFGLGFLFVLEEYGTSEIITNYFAKKFVGEIFYDNKYSLEELIHLDTKSFEYIDNIGINNYLINYVRRFDNNLANYLCCHLEILDKIKKNISAIKYNWNNYMNNLNEMRLEIIYQDVKKYIEEKNMSYHVSYFEIISIAVKKLNLIDLFRKYDAITYIDDDLERFGINDKDKSLSLSELRCLEFTIKLIDELFKKDVIDSTYCDYYQELYEDNVSLKTKAKILNFRVN